MMASPCWKDGKDCPKRSVGCHSACPDYLAFAEERRALSEHKAEVSKRSEYFKTKRIKLKTAARKK